jgi:phosphoglycolate phosphatase
MRLCIFDLDHTLVRSSLDLAAMALDMRAFLERERGPLPPREERYRIVELVAWSRAHAPDLEEALWTLASDHERRALGDATLEPGALDAVTGARTVGFATAVWTNNMREVTATVLERFGLTAHLDLVVTRDEMRALKPDPDGWRVIAGHFAAVREAVMVGDSWVDGVAAAAAGVPFVAYRPKPAELERHGVKPVAALDDLAALPAWLRTRPAAGTDDPAAPGRTPRAGHGRR